MPWKKDYFVTLVSAVPKFEAEIYEVFPIFVLSGTLSLYNDVKEHLSFKNGQDLYTNLHFFLQTYFYKVNIFNLM